jgi:hypothetical protein
LRWWEFESTGDVVKKILVMWKIEVIASACAKALGIDISILADPDPLSKNHRDTGPPLEIPTPCSQLVQCRVHRVRVEFHVSTICVGIEPIL